MHDRAEASKKNRENPPLPWKDLDNKRMSIGQISKVSKVSIRSIRHYCELGLIKPTFIDAHTKYRYFSYDQITGLLLIKDMRALGFSLDQIHQVLHGGNLRDNIAMVDAKIHQTRTEIEVLEEKERRLLKLNHMFKDMGEKTSNKISYEIKTMPERRFLVHETKDDKTDGLAYLRAYEQLLDYAKDLGCDTGEQLVSFLPSLDFSTFEASSMRYGVELFNEGLNRSHEKESGFEHYVLKKGLYACMRYSGDYRELYSEGYNALVKWLQAEKRTHKNEIIEIYHITRPFDTMSESPLTEIQVKLTQKST